MATTHKQPTDLKPGQSELQAPWCLLTLTAGLNSSDSQLLQMLLGLYDIMNTTKKEKNFFQNMNSSQKLHLQVCFQSPRLPLQLCILEEGPLVTIIFIFVIFLKPARVQTILGILLRPLCAQKRKAINASVKKEGRNYPSHDGNSVMSRDSPCYCTATKHSEFEY